MNHATQIIQKYRLQNLYKFLPVILDLDLEERSLLWQSAARDRRNVEDVARRLVEVAKFSVESVEAMKSLAFAAAWHAANQRRFFFSDAEKDRRSREKEIEKKAVNCNRDVEF